MTTRTIDLDAARAAKAEALGEPFTFTHQQHTFTIPDQAQWPLTVLDLMSDGKIVAALKELLGPDQWTVMQTLPPLTLDDVKTLFDAVASAMGVQDLGN